MLAGRIDAVKNASNYDNNSVQNQRVMRPQRGPEHLGAIGGGLALGGTTLGYGLATGGAVAGATSSMIGTALNSNGKAGFSEYMLSGGFGGAMGGLNGVGSIVGLGTGAIGAGIGASYGNAAAGFQIGDMVGGMVSGGIDDYGRAIGNTASRFAHAAKRVGVEGGFTAGGAAVGYAATGTMDGALMGASIGQAIGGAVGNFAVACFTAGTPLVIDMEGNSRPIDEIEVGDFVLARSEFDPDGPLELKRVEEKFVRTSVVMELVVHGQSIKTTAEHPFFVPAQGKFVAAGELQAGEQLVGHDGKLVQIESIGSTGEVTTVYNLRVADFHTYFVGGGLWGFDVWVHNATYKVAPKGGAHGQTKLPWGDGFESHHMPPKSVNGLHPDVGPAIKMERVDHVLTSSHGSRSGSAVYRSHIEDLLNQGKVREAMAIEINDVRRAAMQGSGDLRKYNEAIREMLQYAGPKGIGYVPKK